MSLKLVSQKLFYGSQRELLLHFLTNDLHIWHKESQWGLLSICYSNHQSSLSLFQRGNHIWHNDNLNGVHDLNYNSLFRSLICLVVKGQGNNY